MKSPGTLDVFSKTSAQYDGPAQSARLADWHLQT